MALPKAVQMIGDAADRELQKLKDAQAGVIDSGTEGNPELNTDGDDLGVVPGIVTPVEGTPLTQIPDQPLTGFDWQAEATAQKAEVTRLTQANSVLQGKYNAEVPLLNERIRLLESQIKNPESTGAPTASLSDGSMVEVSELGLTQEEIEENVELYGESWLNSQRKIAASMKASILAAVKPQIENLNKGDSDRQGVAMNARLTEAHSDWEVINEMATWWTFINEVDEATGKPRRDTIVEQYSVFNEIPFVLALTQFKKRSGMKGNALETQVVPADSARTQAGEGQTQDTNQYRRDVVHAFYNDAPNLLKSGKMTKETYDRLDGIYTKADMQGRVVG